MYPGLFEHTCDVVNFTIAFHGFRHLTHLCGAHLEQTEWPSRLLEKISCLTPHQKNHQGAKCVITIYHQGPFCALKKLLDPRELFCLWKLHWFLCKFYEKASFTRLIRKEILFLLFANFFHVWLNRRQMDSCICFCMQSIAVYCFKIRKENLASHRSIVAKGEGTFY